MSNEALIKLAVDRASVSIVKNQINQFVNDYVSQIKTADKSWDLVSTQIKNVGKNMVSLNFSVKNAAGEVRTLGGEFNKIFAGTRGVNGLFGQNAEQIKGSVQNFRTLKEEAKKSNDSIIANIKSLDVMKLALRALIVAPVWQIIRSGMQSVEQAVDSVIKRYEDLDAGMTKVMAVTERGINNQKLLYNELEGSVRSYYTTSIASMKDITDAMYELGSAGRSSSEMMAGFSHIMSLSLASYTDITTIAKTVSSTLNIFGEDFKNIGNIEKQTAYITDMLTDTWKKHQIEVSEVSQAMSYLGPVAAASGAKFEELLAAVGSMADVGLRGAKGGRLLASAIGEISEKAGKLNEMGLNINPYGTLKFMEVMKELHELYLKQGKALENNKLFIEIFGKEGSRAILDILVNWESFRKDVDRTKDSVAGVTDELKKLRESTWKNLGEKAWRQMTGGSIDIASENAGSLKSAIADALYERDKATTKVQQASILTNMASSGSLQKSQLSETEARQIYRELGATGAPNAASAFKKSISSYGYELSPGITGYYSDNTYARAYDRNIIGNVYGRISSSNNTAKNNIIGYQSPLNTLLQTNTISDIDARKYRAITSKLNESQMSLLGYSNADIQREKIKEYVGSYNSTAHNKINIEDALSGNTQGLRNSLISPDTIKEVLELSVKYKEEVAKINEEYTNLAESNSLIKLQSMGLNSIEVQKEYIRMLEERGITGKRIIEEEFKLQRMLNEEVLQYSKALSEAMSKSLYDKFSGKGNTNMFAAMGAEMKDQLNKTMADSLTANFMKQTGFGEMFGRGMQTVSQTLSGTIENSHLKGITEGAQIIINAHKTGMSGGENGVGNLITSTNGLMDLGSTVFKSDKLNETAETANNAMDIAQLGMAGVTGKSSNGTMAPSKMSQFMTGAKGLASTGMQMYGYYQAGDNLAKMYKQKGSGDVMGGVMSGAASGAMLGSKLGPIGTAVGAIVGGIYGGIMSGQSKTTEAWEQSTIKITSKIAISNKHLEMVNRNLVALKNTLEAYILPDSAYFSEKRNLSDEFSLASRRGVA